jgi:pimeloyl-ACP methyl ester carboxylesterase
MAIDLTRRTVQRGGVDLAVFEGGNPDGPTVLLVHGWPDTHLLWLGVMEHLAPDFRVVAYDTRGQGQSGDPGADAAFALPELAADLLAVIDAVSPDRPVHLVGHDWGSVQAWEAVCGSDGRRRVASFVSLSGPCIDHVALWLRRQVRPPTPRSLARLARQSASSAYLWFFLSPVAAPVLRRAFTPEKWRRYLHRTERACPPEEEIAASLTDDMVSGLRYYRANVLPRLRRPQERRTDVPVLLLVLGRDPAIHEFLLEETPRWVARLERRDLPFGHWAALVRPDLIASEVAAFLRRLDADAQTAAGRG